MGVKQLISRTALKERGWTDAAIKKFSSGPDATAPNPHYKSAAPVQLYDLARIKRIEKTKLFLIWREKSVKRQAAAKRAVETKLQKLIAEVESWVIELPDKSFKAVRDEAIKSYNERQKTRMATQDFWGNYDWQGASVDSSDDFLERIIVNYIRHRLTHYHDKLVMMFGKVGKDQGYLVLFKKICLAISVKWPELAHEAKDQYRQRKISKGG